MAVMDIQCILDAEDEEQLVDPFGAIVLTNGKKTISEQDTFLYEWLYGLTCGLKKLQAGEFISVWVNEPPLVLFEPHGTGIRIKYGEQDLTVDTVEEFEQALRAAIKELLQKLYALGDLKPNFFLEEIKRFVSS
jgi:hypothetical protein